MTVPHRQLLAALGALNVDVEVETSFPPYHVDCYLPDFHVALEADGPQHSASKDADRDAVLMARYALPVYRVDSGILAQGTLAIWRELALTVWAQTWGLTMGERRRVARAAGGFVDEHGQ